MNLAEAEGVFSKSELSIYTILLLGSHFEPFDRVSARLEAVELEIARRKRGQGHLFARFLATRIGSTKTEGALGGSRL